ncbi:MAG: FAD-binding protein [Anaerolineales bacterium]|nr:FAD-binding protein [Anaerolineales bacterium]
MIPITNLETDVLIVGGGGAGARAALAAQEAGLKTTLVVKGLLGKSGCSIFAGNLNYFAPPKDQGGQPKPEAAAADQETRVRRTMQFLAKYTHYLGDQEYMRKASEFTQTEFYPWIERRGIYMLRDEQGDIISDQPRRTQAWAAQMGMSGTLVMDLLRKLILGSPIQLLEQTTATRLLLSEGEVVGAAALDFVRGRFYLIHAKVVILATGHSNYLSLRSTGTRDGSASGWVMAYEAGARLQNIEMQWYHASDVAYPATWMRLHMYPNPLPGTVHRSQLVNNAGETFFDGNWHLENPVPYIMQLKHLVKEIRAGQASLEGGYYSSYRHVERQVLEDYIYQTRFMKKIGVDLKDEVIENGVTWHMNVGGVRVDGQTMESGVPGLLIAGSVGGLVTGGLPNVMYDGLVAARTAAERARALPAARPLDAGQVAAEQARVMGLLRTEPRDGLLPGQAKKRIRRVMWERHNYIKTETSMLAALDGLRQVEEDDLPRMRLQTDTTRFNYDWVDALDAHDMLRALQLEVQFCLFRKESRGAFYREDYPQTNNQDWLVHVVGSKGADGQLRLERLPVDLPYAQPQEQVASFFEVDY